MKKCVIFFTLLIITLMIAILTEGEEKIILGEEVAMGQSTMDNLINADEPLEVE